jgi:DNA repair exonuclease SbcCD ATPase subunit
MTTQENPNSLQTQIAEVKQRLADARSRMPKHDVPAALIAEMDELDEELERLQALAGADPLEAQIAELEQRLKETRARVPKHDVPAALIAEMDELDEELERLRSLRDTSS